MGIAGYSGTPLLHKLGIKPSSKDLLINQPDDYLSLLNYDLKNQLCKATDVPDIIHLFVKSMSDFETGMKKLKPVLKKNSSVVVWVSWYKKAAKIPTDVTENLIRAWALKNDLVDVKVCAVGDVWSGLKLVVPLAKRK